MNEQLIVGNLLDKIFSNYGWSRSHSSITSWYWVKGLCCVYVYQDNDFLEFSGYTGNESPVSNRLKARISLAEPDFAQSIYQYLDKLTA